MSSIVQPFISLLPSQPSRPKSQFSGPAGVSNLIRDQFTIPTWLALGAAAQALVYLLVGLYAFLPASFYLILTAIDTLTITLNIRPNPLIKDVIPKKFTALVPRPDGTFSDKPADSDIVVFLIGTRCNHPLGLVAPGFPKVAEAFTRMAADLDEHAEEFGFLGMTNWVNAASRSSKSEILDVCYFRTVAGLYSFAHSKYHTEAWILWNQAVKSHPYISIYHETYHVPAGNWENIFINSHASHFASATFKVEGEEKWVSPVVDASKGLLKTSMGRMGRSTKADEHEKLVDDPYQGQ